MLDREFSPSFSEEVETHKSSPEVSPEVAAIETMDSSLNIRLRGGYITDCTLTSSSTGAHVEVLYAEEDLTKPKITATHSMLPAGPSEGIGGQHGFPRWADYHKFQLEDGQEREKHIAFQAMRSDDGLSLVKEFKLTGSSLETTTTIRSSEDAAEQTSIGEHLYFSLVDENIAGLTINGAGLDELLGEGSEQIVMNDGTLYWGFDGEATIHFPAGHEVKLSATFDGESRYPFALWIWKRPGSPSICFEPIVGVEYLDDDDTTGMTIPPYGSATLSTKIELL